MTDTLTAPAAGQGSVPGATPSTGAVSEGLGAGAGTPAAAPNTNAPWYAGADELTTGYVQNKGWKAPLDAVQSYQNLEKLMGADKAGNAVVLPKPDASAEELAKFYDRLGRPSDPSGYKLQVPDGAPKDFATAAAAKLHELGLTQKQGEALGAWWNEQANGTLAAQQAAKDQAYQADDLALRTQWGAAFQQNLVQAQAAVRGLGIDTPTIDKLQAAMGHKAVMELFHTIGSKMGEATFVSGSRPEGFGAAMTPAQAKSEIKALSMDKGFTAKLLSKDAEANAKWTQLHKFAFPEEER